MKIEQFGQLVKSKYPQYNTYSDKKIGELMIQKYPQYSEKIDKKSMAEKFGDFLSETAGLKGTGEAIGASLFGGKVAEKITQKALSSNELIEQAKRLPQGSLEKRQLLEQAQGISSYSAGKAEGLLEKIPTRTQAAGSMAKLGLTVGTFGTPSLATGLGLRGVGAVATKIGEGGVIGALYKATDNLEKQKPIGEGVGTAFAIGATIPAVGAGLTGLKKLAGKTGEKIQYTVIKPSAADIKDGFKIETIQKHNLGGSLGEMAHNTQDKLNKLTTQLQGKVKRTDVTVDLNDVYGRTAKKLVGDKAKSFGNIASSRRVLENLKNEIDEVSNNGLVDLAESQTIKQASGLKGSWVFGSADPDASAVEKVYTAFYRELKEEIENKAPTGVKEINQQISELIPVMNAIIRRIPIAERNNVLSLTDIISAGFTTIHPSGIALATINRLSKSARVGSFLAGIKPKEPVTNIGKRLFGF